ncbi:MAG: hypothetical protein QOK49_4854 [Baekduia sp.]|nr:hypothetical protein [Baekduia sp.]
MAPAAPSQRALALRAARSLWFPLLFSAGLALAYLAAFHHPRPHRLPVAIVAPAARARPLAAALERADAFSVRVAASPAAARTQLLHRAIVGAYVPGPGRPRIFVARAGSPSAGDAAVVAFRAVAAATRAPAPAITDLRPVQAGDYRGTSPFYLMIAWSIGGYITAIVLGAVATAMAGAGVRLEGRTRAALLLPTALVAVALCVLIAGPILHALDGHALALIGVGWLYASAVGLVGLGLHYFLGRHTTAVMVMLFVVLNFPSAGGAYDVRLQPSAFVVLHDAWPGASAVTAIRDVVYFGGDGVWARLGLIALWGVAGAAILAAGIRHGEPRVEPATATGAAELEVAEAGAG